MLESNDILKAMTDIDDSYIQDAHELKHKKVLKWRRFKVKSVAAAAVAIILIGTTTYGATFLVRQLRITSYDNVEDMMKEHHISPWDSSVAIQDVTISDEAFSDLTAKSLIDIITPTVGQPAEGYHIEYGTDADKWNRKYSETETYNEYENAYYEAYEYSELGEAFEEYNIPFDLNYIQTNYPNVAGEYGCDFLYSDVNKEKCLQQRFFSGYCNADGNFVSIEYCENYVEDQKNPYILYDGDANVSYYTTDDGVEVFITKGRKSTGESLVTARVYTKNSILYVGIFGSVSADDVKNILNSLNIAEGMHLDVN